MKPKKASVWIVISVFLPVFFSAGTVCAETSAAMDLVNMLTGQLGVTEPQATGGAGALFNMAKGALSESDYSQVTDAIPGISDLIKAAPEVLKSTTKTSDKISGLAGKMGSMTKAIDSANKFAAVNDQFKQLGLDPAMVSKFIPVLLSFSESAGGEAVMNLLKSVWQ